MNYDKEDEWDWSDTWWLIKRRVKDFYWQLQYRFNPRHKYHIINIRGADGVDFSFHYSDINHRMLYANFKLLCEFIEHEDVGIARINWESDPGHSHAIREMRALYFWWKFQRQADIDEADAMFDKIWKDSVGNEKFPWNNINETLSKTRNHPLDTEYENLRNYVDTIDDKQLERLVKIRNYLWT